jgi:nucleoside-diphosphate-sugar epimerase
MSGRDAVLVTGARGFIGAWVVKALLAEGRRVVALDADPDRARLDAVLEDDDTKGLSEIPGDVTDLASLSDVIDRERVGSVIHLAALQIPACAANPSRGALVNVVGTTNVLIAARDAGLSKPVVYASSVAALGVASPEGPPITIYGVFKRANESTAALMWRDEEVASIGIRPHTVYGVGRDQGLTSAPTKAMLHAAAGQPYHIGYGGSFQMQLGLDVARAFIAASDSGFRGATVVNLPTPPTDMASVVAAIEEALPNMTGRITFETKPLPLPAAPALDNTEAVLGDLAETPLAVGVEATIRHFQRLLDHGRIPLPETPG